jgi:ubiquinone/menaquinone biosynthesis C-methylase UbiE
VPDIANTDQAQAWNGSEGTHWARHQDRWNAVNGGFDQPLLDAAAITGEHRILDVGCGSGQTTRRAARRAPRGRALGLDLSAPMLAEARARASATSPSYKATRRCTPSRRPRSTRRSAAPG